MKAKTQMRVVKALQTGISSGLGKIAVSTCHCVDSLQDNHVLRKSTLREEKRMSPISLQMGMKKRQVHALTK